MIEDTIFRVIQESMTNAVRHGHASRMDLIFEDEEDYLIELQDNGVGFETLTYGYGTQTDDGAYFHSRRTASI